MNNRLNPKRFTVILDMDSVSYDLNTPWLEWYNKNAGDSLTHADINQWDWAKIVRPGWQSKIYDFLHIEYMFFNLHPFPGAVEATKVVHEWGTVTQLFGSTVKTRTGAYEKQHAVDRDFPHIGSGNVLTTGHIKAFKGDVLFVDGYHNLEAFDGITCKVNLQGSPYSDHYVADLDMTNWSQYPDLVKQAQIIYDQSLQEVQRN